jgi:hypothetical protein
MCSGAIQNGKVHQRRRASLQERTTLESPSRSLSARTQEGSRTERERQILHKEKHANGDENRQRTRH